ncbi:hypothetical protein K431DRAFT_256534 [Polychaeton citri CBS 116435]|uniref:Arrestin-like N-terminal domain-containing protein n=1 Tax=Polychaeton citri CBS 116435 TaxID=1314669 RepID=A0A9P4UJZ8_9PEZI|nr:hypothetical protein K431DRAFT_256534 [Polychaeton citri CBS 116435]
MNATIVLNQAANVSYTNLDEISGRVLLRLTKAAEISNIVVKLEGESRSRLLSPQGPNGEKPRPQLEYHKILYQLKIVFPPQEVLESRSPSASAKAAYTVSVGQHEYPFSFKIPFNNSCSSTKSNMPNVSMSSMGLEIAKPPVNHVRKLLPPTLSGFPGEAEIRYFVKATVVRHSFFKENPRAYVPFNFVPLEEPRPPASGSEVYARQRHTFTPVSGSEQTKAKMKSIFGMGEKSGKSASAGANDAPSLAMDARLPDPAILTCNNDVPLRVIVRKLNGSTNPVYLDSLQVSLIGFTKIRAHEVWRTESHSWVLVSKSNMGMQISNPSAPAESEAVLDDRLWRGIPLPNTVAPTFQTCNIGRTYQLDLRLGLSYNGTSAAKPQNIVLPLRLDCLVYSGIAPSSELLERVAKVKTALNNRRVSSTPSATSRPLNDKKPTSVAGGSNITGLPTSTEPQNEPTPIPPPRPGTSSQTGQQQTYDDAPPSYEDAIASELPPMDAPRPDYAPPPPAEDDALRRDEKRGWH